MSAVPTIVHLGLLLVATSGASPESGRMEVVLRGADIVFSREDSFESVFRVPFPASLGNSHVDVARIEVEIVVDGDGATFTPFIVVASAVEPDPENPGEFRTLGQYLAREFVFEPSTSRTVKLSGTALARAWSETGSDAYLRILIDEPIPSDREPDFVRFSSPDVLGRVIVLTRPIRTVSE